MKTLDLQKIIREEIKKALKEADTDSIADQYYLALENVESFKRLGMDGQGELIAIIVKHLAKQGIK